MRFLVTGACGFIGAHLVSRLVSDGHVVVGVDRCFSSVSEERLRKVHNSNLFSLLDLDLAVDSSGLCEGVDMVIHLAARTAVNQSIIDSDPFLRDNVLATQALLKDASRNKPNKFVLISTGEVYRSLSMKVGQYSTGN